MVALCKKLAYSLLVVSALLLVSLLSYSQVNALDPDEETLTCLGNEEGLSSDGRPCSEVNCKWRNIANNWPEDTGYEEDCSGEEKHEITHDSSGSGSGADGGSSWVYILSGVGLVTFIFIGYITKKHLNHNRK